MTFTDRRRRFRAVLEGSDCVHPASVYDAISARIAEDLGFETAIFAGSTAALIVLGGPDIVVLTLTEFAEQIRRITRAGSIPLLVDADHGYGNALSVMRTVQELECAGVSALTIEDTALPRGFAEAETRLVSLEEGLGKVRAALAARVDPSLVIVARTSAMAITGTEDAVARAGAYAKAGADALFFAGLSHRSQIEAVRAATKVPMIIGGWKGDLGDRSTLASLGVRVALQGHQPLMATIRAVHETLSALRQGAEPRTLTNQPSPELVNQVTRAADYERAVRDFLS